MEGFFGGGRGSAEETKQKRQRAELEQRENVKTVVFPRRSVIIHGPGLGRRSPLQHKVTALGHGRDRQEALQPVENAWLVVDFQYPREAQIPG